MTKILQKVDFLQTFPSDSTPRPQQTKALEEISRIFSEGKKYAIACLPTGSGKSHISSSIAKSSTPIDSYRKQLIETYAIYQKDKSGTRYLYEDDFLTKEAFGSFILTITKSLQDQYKGLFPDVTISKGKSNYPCEVCPSVSVDHAPCLYSAKQKDSCLSKDGCTYYKVRSDALKSIDPIFNYRTLFSLPAFLRKREYYICDEASDIESELVSQYSISISYAQLISEGIEFNKVISDDSTSAGMWLGDIYIKLKDELADVKAILLKASQETSHAAIKPKQLSRLSKLNSMVSSIGEIIELWDDCSYMVEKKDSAGVTFVPYNIRPIFKNIFQGADKVLMMSATITDVKEFTKSLGISEDEYEYVEIPSSFDPKKSPIKCSSLISLSQKNLEKDLPKVIETALKVCEAHKGQKGIIHTHTHFITQEIQKRVRGNPRFLFREQGISNESIVEQHKQRKDDTILVSPSLDTGVSLDGDLGRFQIIVKAPFLSLGSKRIKKIFDKNPKYYMMKMLDTLVQMCGRCTRSAEDHSVTYILDGTIVRNIKLHAKTLPKHFLERFE